MRGEEAGGGWHRIAHQYTAKGILTDAMLPPHNHDPPPSPLLLSHGTVADMWNAHRRGEETSFNPLGMVEALMGAMNHAAVLAGGQTEKVRYRF